jgi:hypothetical protein
VWRSPGAEPARLVRGLAVAALLIAPGRAWGETGQEAFARQDYAAAAELWRAEAAEGSAEAKFGLGLIHDLGLGVPRSSAAALRWYLEAAGEGLADAQFNVGVMFDAGTGVPRDPATAATWYARAAANGHARAQYNLALLYENGIGVPRDPDLARTWYQAASPVLAAAADRLAQLPPPEEPTGEGPPPQPILGAVVGPPDAPRAELVWIATGGPHRFRVQLARGGSGSPDEAEPGRDELVLSRNVDQSAVAIDLPEPEADLLWRVGRVGGEGTAPAWSAWQALAREPMAEEPRVAAAAGRVTIHVNADDDLARAFADELSQVYGQGGVEVTVRDADRPASATTVEYRFPQDAELAAAVAEFLPALRLDSPVQALSLDTPPGEVTVRLVGGPSPSVDG